MQQKDIVTLSKSVDKQKIVPDDVLNVYRLIESYKNTSDKVKNVQKELLINNLCKCKKDVFFNNRLIYWNYVGILINVGSVSDDEELIRKTYHKLNNIGDSISKLSQYNFNEKIYLFYSLSEEYNQICTEYKRLGKTEGLSEDLFRFYSKNIMEFIKQVRQNKNIEVHTNNETPYTKKLS